MDNKLQSAVTDFWENRVWANNQTGTAYVDFSGAGNIRTEPTSGNGWIGKFVVMNHPTLWLLPFGTGNIDTAGTIRVTRVRQVGPKKLWIPQVAFEGSFTLSTWVGQAGLEFLDTERAADDIVQTAGDEYVQIAKGPANTPAMLGVDMLGCPWVFVELLKGTATGVNAYGFTV